MLRIYTIAICRSITIKLILNQFGEDLDLVSRKYGKKQIYRILKSGSRGGTFDIELKFPFFIACETTPNECS